MVSFSRLLLAVHLLLLATGLAAQSPVGFASLNGNTSGGDNGILVSISSVADLITHAGSSQEATLQISDTITLPAHTMVEVASNKTIEGLGTEAMIQSGGLWIRGNNVIIRNLKIGNSYDGDWSGMTHETDAIRISGQNVWVDHCDLFAAANALVQLQSDGSEAPDFVTISNCRFSNQNQVILLGGGPQDSTCRGHNRCTIVGCWFDGRHDHGLGTYAPGVWFGQVHVLNNYYEQVEGHCAGAWREGEVVVEGNFFRDLQHPHIVREIGLGITDPIMAAIGNSFEFTTGDKESFGTAFSPSSSYPFMAMASGGVPGSVINKAGIQRQDQNRVPHAVTDTLRFDNQQPINLVDATLNDLDDDGDELLISAVMNDPGGDAQVKDNRIYYYPLLHFGSDTVVYQIADGQGGLATGTILVNPVPDSSGTTLPLKASLHQGWKMIPQPARLGMSAILKEASQGDPLKHIFLLDMQGRRLREVPLVTWAGEYILNFSEMGISPGIYFLEGMRLSGQLIRMKIMIIA